MISQIVTSQLPTKDKTRVWLVPGLRETLLGYIVIPQYLYSARLYCNTITVSIFSVHMKCKCYSTFNRCLLYYILYIVYIYYIYYIRCLHYVSRGCLLYIYISDVYIMCVTWESAIYIHTRVSGSHVSLYELI